MNMEHIESKIDEFNSENNMDATVGVLKNIADRNIVSYSHALLELIKNSYDEDSSDVLINFVEREGKISEIRVVDGGYGFTRKGFDSFKLIGKSQKKPNNKTPLGRIATGMYGSGAYSTIKLGNYLKIESINYEENYFFSKEIDWSMIYENSDKRIRDLIFKDLVFKEMMIKENNQFISSRSSGTKLIIKKIKNNINFKEIINDLLYITIRKDFIVRFAIGGKEHKTINFIDRLNYLKNYIFVEHIVSFSYLQGKIKINLNFNNTEIDWEIDSLVDDFQGMISGEYLSINKDLFNENKKIFDESPLFKKREALNLFYNNEMLILTDESLGLNLQPMSIRDGYTFGFRNSLGYTSIQETSLIFNESRTNITDDIDGQYQKYKLIIDEIFKSIVKKIRFIKKNNVSTETDGKKTDLIICRTPKIAPISMKAQIYGELENVRIKLISKNLYYKELNYCISELKRIINQKNYLNDFNISFYAVVRIYCEILFIYKIYDFFKENKDNLRKIVDIFKKNESNDFKSIGSLIRILGTNQYFLTKELFNDFREKTGVYKWEQVYELVENVNKHIHKPSEGIQELIAIDLIRIFTKWL